MTIFPPRSLMHGRLEKQNTLVCGQMLNICLLPQARIYSPSVIWHALWNGPVTSACRGSAPSSTSVWRFPLQSTSSLRLLTARPVSFGSLWYKGCTLFFSWCFFWMAACKRKLWGCFFFKWLMDPSEYHNICKWCERIFAIWIAVLTFHQDHWCSNLKYCLLVML